MAQRDQPQYAPRTTDTKKSVCATSLVAQGAAVVAEATLIPSIGDSVKTSGRRGRGVQARPTDGPVGPARKF